MEGPIVFQIEGITLYLDVLNQILVHYRIEIRLQQGCASLDGLSIGQFYLGCWRLVDMFVA